MMNKSMAPKNTWDIIVGAITIPNVHTTNATAVANKITVVSFMCVMFLNLCKYNIICLTIYDKK